MVASVEYFYDAQIERFLIQFIRAVSGFQVEFGQGRDGTTTLQRVPVYYGDGSRQVAQIISNNSENVMPVVPAMTVYINGITYDRDRVQEPTFEGKMHIRQKFFNEDSGEYENRQGKAYTVERLMPVPYTLELKLDIWTSNTKQKLQLLEQIVVLFNPALEIQSTDNYVDWTSLSVIFLESPTWTSRSVPIGTENPIDVATLTFKIPIWISPPAKVKKMGVIHKIIANIHNAQGELKDEIYNDANLMGARNYYTPLDYGVLLVGNELTLLRYSAVDTPTNGDITQSGGTLPGSTDIWRSLINVYGVAKNGISQIRLTQEDRSIEIVGTVSFHPTDDTKLIYNIDIDTLPVNTLTAINKIIDPAKVNVASDLLTPAVGTRYLILKNIGSFANFQPDAAPAWQGANGISLVASANDIIEYNGQNWFVSFDSSQTTSVQYVSNLTTGVQYKWNLNQWVKSFEGEYKNGAWTLVL